MAPVKVKPEKPSTKKSKKSKKKRLNAEVTPPKVEEPLPPPVRHSDEPPPKKPRWTNRQRVLIFAARGITHRDRHLMEDLRGMFPHSRPDSKMERTNDLSILNQICQMKNCNKCIFFECKKRQDLYMWMSNVPDGPAAKFLVQNVYTMGELKLTGNSLKGSRPLLSFDPNFDTSPHLQLLKEMFVQTFGTPNRHPRSQPFFDHVLSFSVLDNRIWFRNYQIVSEDGSLAEIGPRFVLNPINIFANSFKGPIIWENPHYKSPNFGSKYEERVQAKLNREMNQTDLSHEPRSLDDIFHGDALEAALALEAQQSEECEMATLPDQGPSRPKRPKKPKVKPTLSAKKKMAQSKAKAGKVMKIKTLGKKNKRTLGKNKKNK
ncbi:hypothetical protein B566_EDAN005106 [Ephemera danica]|nr:hypothetical protein B566_EDAN005106 [Ephemera danica]